MRRLYAARLLREPFLDALARELHPLRRGATLAFAPYPRGEVFLVAADGKALDTWRLSPKRVYQSGDSFLADAGDRVLFAYSHTLDATRLLAI